LAGPLSRLEKIRGFAQGGLGLGDETAHYFGDSWDIFDASRCLARRE
jgi:hypothetical protein